MKPCIGWNYCAMESCYPKQSFQTYCEKLTSSPQSLPQDGEVRVEIKHQTSNIKHEHRFRRSRTHGREHGATPEGPRFSCYGSVRYQPRGRDIAGIRAWLRCGSRFVRSDCSI